MNEEDPDRLAIEDGIEFAAGGLPMSGKAKVMEVFASLTQERDTLRAENERLKAAQRHAWEAGFVLCRSYGDNHANFDGEQKERRWKAYLASLETPRPIEAPST